MEDIVEPTRSYDFGGLTCISPTSITGGNYFIRILKNLGQKPFYIQPPKCTTKQGIVKSGKKLVCDLLFKHEDEAFTEFLESLETFCRSQLFLHKEKWFDSELTEADIEESFSPTAKLFKSGKLHSVRVNIPIRLGKCCLKVFNEDEKDVNFETIVDTTQIMSILEIQGIRCSARSFQLELEVKQMMILNPVNLFETCLFTKTGTTLVKEHDDPPPEVKEQEVEIDLDENTKLVDSSTTATASTHIELESLADSVVDLDEVTIEAPLEKEEMKLKKRNHVYYNMYKEAKRKARIARDFAIASYLEAKQIRHNFLEDADLSEDDDHELECMENSHKSL